MTLFRFLVVLIIWCSAQTALSKETVLAFTASWCGPCKQFKRDLAANPEMLGDYGIEVFDVDSAKEMAKDFNVRSFPTFIVLDVGEDGVLRRDKELRRHSGYSGAGSFRSWLANKTLPQKKYKRR